MSWKPSLSESRATTAAVGLLRLALIVQIAWTIFYTPPRLSALTRPLISTGGFLLVALTRGAMLLGIKTRWAAGGSAALLLLFAAAMTMSGVSQAGWAVYVLSAGALALTRSNASSLSVDSLMALAEASRG